VGFEDETWWSRLVQPNLYSWVEGKESLRLIEQSVAKDDPDSKAMACYGLLVRDGLSSQDETWLRFVDGRPVSEITTTYLAWCCTKFEAKGKKVFVLVWDNASWHVGKKVQGWIKAHNRQVKLEGKGIRIVQCRLPIKSPWLNPIEPYWVHGKRKVAEADGHLSSHELMERVCALFGCTQEGHLAIPDNVS
jgi:hypothetical protein